MLFKRFMLLFSISSALVVLSFVYFADQSLGYTFPSSMSVQSPVDPWPRAKQTLNITARFVDNIETVIPFTAIIEVRNDEGITIHSEVQTGKANPFSYAIVSTSWTPPTAGWYEFRAFAISNFTEPEILTDISDSGIVIRPLVQGSTAWVAMNTTQCDNQWDREYYENRERLREGETPFDVFFEKREIEIYEAHRISYVPPDTAGCQACNCTSGSTLYLLISEADVEKMVNEYGFIEQEP